MAPELARGSQIGPEVDVYALGCVGYWLLSGRKPFTSKDPEELIRQHATHRPADLVIEGLGKTGRRLAEIIMSCLSKYPSDRPVDAEALGVALNQVI